MSYARVLIIADIEGSSGCWNDRGSSFLTLEWLQACQEMTRDVDQVVKALMAHGISEVWVQDFHRTAYNLLPAQIDPRAKLIHGYRAGPIPGIGPPGPWQGVFFLGMHAAAGTPGFLAHTLTSRLARCKVNGRPLSEVELFAASLAPWGVKPLFFSGCPLACRQAENAMAGIVTYAIDKKHGLENFDAPSWRQGLAAAAVRALANKSAEPYRPPGPFEAWIRFRRAKGNVRIARRWGLMCRQGGIRLIAVDLLGIYQQLIRLCYLTPLSAKLLPASLWLFNLKGRAGLQWLRWRRAAVQRH